MRKIGLGNSFPVLDDGTDFQNVFSATGGITTLIDMPIHSKPPITSTDSLFKKVSAANGKVCFAIDDITM